MSPKEFEKINFKMNYGIAVITLGQDGNTSLDFRFWEELDFLLTYLEYQGSPPLLILGGVSCFSEGVDLQWLLLLTKRKYREGNLLHALYDVSCFITETAYRLRTYNNLSISLASGKCVGMGAELFLMSDVRVITDDFLFSLPELSLSMVPDVCGLKRLNNVMGRDRALSVLITGQDVNAKDAISMNIATYSLPSYDEAINTSKYILTNHLKNNDTSVYKYMKRQLHIDVVPDELKVAKDAVRYNIENFNFKNFEEKINRRIGC